MSVEDSHQTNLDRRARRAAQAPGAPNALAGSPVYHRRMTREVRIGLWILTVLLLAALVTPALGFYPLVVLLYYGWPLVPLAMAWGMLDAAYHRDSVWREADQNKVVWVLVQFIPLVGTMAYYILVHPTVLKAENRVRRS
jgi:hypothetical protein